MADAERPLSAQSPLDAPTSLPAAMQAGSEEIAAALQAPSDHPDMKRRQLAALFLGQFALYVAFIPPTAFSLAIRIQAIAPDQRDVILALAVGIPGLIGLIVTPLVGFLSDRTRLRFGRRRTWIVAAAITGLVGSTIVGLSTTAPILIVGWGIAFVGYTAGSVMILAHLGDRLPERQRGKVMGITGAIVQIAPITGIVAAGALVDMPALMFIVPALFAFVGLAIFTATMRDPQVTEAVPTFRITQLLEGFWFNPRRFPNLGWVWLSKALVFVALAFLQLYGVYLLSSRLGLDSAGIAALAATASFGGVLAAIIGALGSGFLSDKFGTRKPFLVVSALVLAAGLITIGTTTTATHYIVGNLIASLAIGVYGAVDQAIQLDVLPQQENQNGRFLAILNLAAQAPQAVGPFAAAAILGLAGGDYSWVYFAAAAFAVLGALAIIPVSVGKRAKLSTTSVALPR